MLTIKDLQTIFNCGKRKAYELLRVPGFPAMKLGGKYLISAKALDGYRRTQERRLSNDSRGGRPFGLPPLVLSYRVQQSVQTCGSVRHIVFKQMDIDIVCNGYLRMAQQFRNHFDIHFVGK